MTKICPICGKKFETKQARTISCSPECAKERQRIMSREWQRRKNGDSGVYRFYLLVTNDQYELPLYSTPSLKDFCETLHLSKERVLVSLARNANFRDSRFKLIRVDVPVDKEEEGAIFQNEVCRQVKRR